MAYRLGVTVNTYANIEKGRVDITTSKLYAVAQLLGIRTHQILALAEEVLEIGEHKWVPAIVSKMIRTD